MLGSLQGLQPNPQQQQIQAQQQNQPLQPGQQASIPPPPPQNGPDFTLSSVLHYLQKEWRRYERDRNEWEIERAEMRVRFCPPLCFPTRHLTRCARHVLPCWRVNAGPLRMLSLI